MKYQSPIPFGSKDIAQVKVFENLVKVQVQGQRAKVMVSKQRTYHKEYTCEI